MAVYPYERCGDVGQHLFGLLGLTASAPDRPVNTSLDALEVEAYRHLKQLAPELLDSWPGLYSVSAREQWPADVSEVFRPGQLGIDRGWRRRFRRMTGWSRGDVDRLLAGPGEPGPDVLDHSAAVQRVVQEWVGARQTRAAASGSGDQ